MTDESEVVPLRPMSSRTCLLEVLLVLACLVVAALLINGYLAKRARVEPPSEICITHQKQLAFAVMYYAAEHADRLPTEEALWTQVASFPGWSGTLATMCPAAPRLSNGYVYNDRLAGKSQNDLPATTTFVTADGQHNATDGRSPNIADTLADIDTARHAPVTGWGPFARPGAPQFVAAFLDGHASRLTPRDTEGWFP
jgi:hypothetical protein